MAKKATVALGLVLVVTALFALCLVSAQQLLVPRDMPIGVTGSSPVVSAVQKKVSLDLIEYSSEDELLEAAERGDIYGGYIPGTSTDTIVTVPAKSFFGELYVRGGFSDAAKQLDRTVTTKVVAPLPTADRTGAVSGLLLLPTLIGGYLIATMLFTFTQRAAAPGRVAIIVGFSVVVALIAGLSAGITGAIPWGHIWTLLPCFALATAAVALSGAAIQHVARGLGTLLMAVLFIVIGGAAAGGTGVSLLPTYWQKIGALLPPRHAIELIRNVRYFDGNNIGTHIAVLGIYALIGIAVIVTVELRRRAAASGAQTGAPVEPSSPPTPKPAAKSLIFPIGLAVLLTTIFGFNYMDSGHEPIATDMPFGVVGKSSLPEDAQGPLFSLDVKEYATQAAATQAMDEGKIYGALVVSDSPGTKDQLTIVQTLSALSPLDIVANFEEAAEKNGDTITVEKPYAPTPLAPKDPFALVCAMLLVPLLVGGYMSTTLLTKSLGAASGRWHGVWLIGFAVVAALVVDLIATFWLEGLPSDSFWIAWPIMALITLSVSLFTAVLRRIAGPVGIFLTVIIVIQFGNPSSGGANGVPYLTTFWRDIGPFLPPRNAYLLLRNTIYFDGHGTGQPLAVLLAYAVIAGALLVLFDWVIDRPPASVPGIEEADGAAVLAPVGPPP
jgi:hypothetical protein